MDGWVEYLSEEPLHPDRSEIQLAQLTHLVASFVGVKDADVSDWMPSVRKEKEPEEQILDLKGKELEDFLFGIM